MGIEIERRFFIDGRGEKPWRGERVLSIFQCYLTGVTLDEGNIVWNGHNLAKGEDGLVNIKTWRIRLQDGEAILTAKGSRTGATATEFEWPLSKDLFDSLSLEGLPSVTKTRYLWDGEDGLLWEVDEFESPLEGLIIAEVELESESQPVIIPSWTGLELTGIRGWSNAALARMLNDAMHP